MSAPDNAGARVGRWQSLVALVERREAGTTLALFRIAIGAVSFASIVRVLLDGAMASLWMQPADGGCCAHGGGPWELRHLGGMRPGNVVALLAASLASTALLTIGVGGRWMAFAALQSLLALANLNRDASGSYDQLATNGLWLLVLARADATLSVACRLRTGRWTSDEPVAAWPRWLIVYQLVLVYASTGAQKVSAYWTPAGGFSALYYILQQPVWQRWDMRWLAWIYPATQLATALSWIWELCAPLLLLSLWYRATRDRPGRLRALFNRVDGRRLFLAVGVPLHLVTAVAMDVGPFPWLVMGFYLCLFTPEEYARAWGALVAWARSNKSATRPDLANLGSGNPGVG